MIARRERGKTERKLISSLTHACEQAKQRLPGFEWLTHRVDYQYFPESLVVVWIFDTDASLAKALGGEARQKVYDLTATALAGANITVADISQHIDFDSEQACKRTDGGDWRRRLRSAKAIH